MIYGFTGTSHAHLTKKQILALDVILFPGDEFHHGDCINSDADAHKEAITSRCIVVIHPCTIESKRAFCQGANTVLEPKKPLDRNKDIVDACDILIAAPMDDEREELRSGTWATIRYARKINKPIIMLER